MRLLFFAIITMTGIGSWNTCRKPRVCRPQSGNGIAAPPLPLKAVVAQRGASWGGYHTNTMGREKVAAVTKSLPFWEGKHRRRRSACRWNGRTRAPFWFAGKRLASFAPAIPHRTGSARRKIGECRICKLGSKLENEKNLGVRKRKNYNYRQ